MSDFLIYIELPPYLAQWYQHEMDQVSPIKLPKNSPESMSIKVHLRKPRDTDDLLPKGNFTAIRIPTYREIDVRTYNMLTDEGRDSLRNIIHDRFCLALYHDLLWLITYEGSFRFKTMKTEKQDRILGWMRRNGIEDNETNFRSVLKNFDRLRDNFQTSARRKPKKH